MFSCRLPRFLAVALPLFTLAVPAAADDDKANPIVERVKSSVKDTSKPFTMIVRLQVKEGEGDKLEAAFAKAVKSSREEKGCLTYQLSRDAKDPTRYVVYEGWKNLDALEHHLKSEYIKTLLSELGGMLAAPPEAHVLLPVGD